MAGHWDTACPYNPRLMLWWPHVGLRQMTDISQTSERVLHDVTQAVMPWLCQVEGPPWARGPSDMVLTSGCLRSQTTPIPSTRSSGRL
jgi:hypothetical protein